jgi:hypothetical protein
MIKLRSIFACFSGRSGYLALAGLAVAIITIRAMRLSFHHSLDSLDGALQTWFALDNFARGEQLGVSFQSYLGITLVLSLLPVFLVFGQTLFASTLAAYVMVVAGAFGSAYGIAWFAQCVPSRDRWKIAVLLVFGFYFAMPMIFSLLGLPAPVTMEPGSSLRPIRGFLPFIVLPFFVALLSKVAREGNALTGGLPLGLIAGAGALWSNDAGVPLIIGMLMGLGLGLQRRLSLLARTVAAFCLGVAISAGGILLAVTHGTPRPWIQYNFRDIAGDQFWYFGPWDRSTRLLSLTDLPNILRQGEPIYAASLILLIVCVSWVMVRCFRGRGSLLRGTAFVFVGTSLIGTALIPQVGGHMGTGYNAPTFVLGTCAPLILFQRKWLRLLRPLLPQISTSVLVALIGLVSVAMVGREAARFAVTFVNTDRVVFDPTLGFHVTPEYAADLAAMRRLSKFWQARGVPRDRRLLSIYTSPLDIAAGVESPTSVGSLIHALGPKNRSDFEGLVAQRKVEAVTTIAPEYSPWEGWILRANWPFFLKLFKNYTPIARNDQHVLWVRAHATKEASASATCRVSKISRDTLVLDISAPVRGYVAVTVRRYPPFADGRSAMLTVTEESPETASPRYGRWLDFPRYGIGNTDTLSLVVPVVKGRTSRLTLNVLDGSEIGGATCTGLVYSLAPIHSLPKLPKGIGSYLADASGKPDEILQ